ncbi:MAG TPA: YabP/YqfC family sporulation protein [Candidatus Lachnoclostridium pullistercoris]|uniref:YabP/YqfC family sporulation protein n=1 Tax=Candidatus Lachnoclostridium pullistercoris TaxID=2838632 RepID=A0A9D2PA70_9FIRM|nr:YabP/YqfC family sporulation protein [Candidatus Lachnoclostridium pullistercoris]
MGRRVRTAAAESLKFPRDVVLGETLISIEGGHSLVIENYRSILFYGDDCLKLLTKNGRVSVEGKGLQIEYYDEESMKITGSIRRVELDGG